MRRTTLACAIGALLLAGLPAAATAGPAPLPDSEYACTTAFGHVWFGDEFNTGPFSLERDMSSDDGENGAVPNAFMLPDEDEGAFRGEGALICEHVNSDNDTPPTIAGTYSVFFEVNGYYENSVCGTGRLRGQLNADSGFVFTGTQTVPPGGTYAAFQGPLQANFDARLAGWDGPLTFSGATNRSGESGDGRGHIAVTPQDTQTDHGVVPCVDEDVTVAELGMTFELHLNDPPVP